MVKVVYFMYRKPGWDVETFQDYWCSTHGDIVRKLPSIRRYTQCHTLISEYIRGIPPPADGIEEISFDSLKFMTSALEVSEERWAAIADLENFTDTTRVFRIFTEEVVIKEGSTHEGMVKSIEFAIRKPDVPLAEFLYYWKNFHGPTKSKIEAIKRYVQPHNLTLEYQKKHPPVYDGVAETWFEDSAAMRHSATTPEYAAHHTDRFSFLAGELPCIATKEMRMIWVFIREAHIIFGVAATIVSLEHV